MISEYEPARINRDLRTSRELHLRPIPLAHASRSTQSGPSRFSLGLKRASCAAAALLLCAVLFACRGVPEAPPVGVDVRVPYPSSAAYDTHTRELLVGSYSDGSVQRIAAVQRKVISTLPHDGRGKVLRIRIDEQSHRIWILASDALYLYDERTSQQLQRFAVEEFLQHSLAHCLPDMALDRSGAVLVSSAIRPELLRIDGRTLEMTRHDLQLDADHGKDFGFSALAFSEEHEELYAASATTGTFWKIDTAIDRATKITLPEHLLGACALRATRSPEEGGLVLYVAGGFRDGVKRIELPAAGPARVRNMQMNARSIAPTDFVMMKRELLVVSSQLSDHPDFNGAGRPDIPFRLVSLPIGFPVKSVRGGTQ